MLIILSATSIEVSIISLSLLKYLLTVIRTPVGVASASFTWIFSLTTGIIKKLLSITRNKYKKHDKKLVVAKIKLDSIETLVSHALIDIEISHEEFITILNEKDKYEKMKESIKTMKSSDELNTEEGKKIKQQNYKK